MSKSILLFSFIALGLLGQTTFAQGVVKSNIASQPIWGPVGYDRVDYYYLPDIEMYYNVPRHRYYYQEKNRWLSRSSLPVSYKNYDMYNARKVVVYGPKPYLNHAFYRGKNEIWFGPANQLLIRDSQDSKYFVNRKHPLHYQLKKSRRRLSQPKLQLSIEENRFN